MCRGRQSQTWAWRHQKAYGIGWAQLVIARPGSHGTVKALLDNTGALGIGHRRALAELCR